MARTSRAATVLANIFALLVCLALFIALLFSLYMNMTEGKAPNGIPSLKVVRSSSMDEKINIQQKMDWTTSFKPSM